MSRRLLLDANMSPRTSQFLVDRFGYDAESLISRGQGHLTDTEVARIAIQEGRVILTFDLDYSCPRGPHSEALVVENYDSPYSFSRRSEMWRRRAVSVVRVSSILETPCMIVEWSRLSR